MVDIFEVKTKKQQKEFIEFPLKLYKDNPYFVPPLYGDEKAIFSPNYMYYDQAEAVFFNAYRDGKMVGRISGILQKAANLKWKQNRARFTRFDAIDDQEVANALFKAVEDWAKSKNVDEIVGPLSFSDLEREGLLIDGFDQLSTFEEQYNYQYYQSLIENCGYDKDVDWIEYKINMPEPEMYERFARVSNDLLKKYNLHFAKVGSTKQLLKRYADKVFALWDEAYDKIYGTVPFTDKVKKAMMAQFALVIDKRYITFVVNENDDIVAFGIVFPSMSKAVQKSGGRLTLPCLCRLLHDINHPKVVDMALIGVTEEYKNKGVALALVADFAERMRKYDVKYAETNLMLEHNNPIQNLWKHFDTTMHKRRRCFIKKFNDTSATQDKTTNDQQNVVNG
ncbi:MAG: N-acetyltransferase [Clostridia bacterium]|nr:N-acetyltransferase [Clostridia bacterium]